jgi:hypothetical protein
MAHEELKKQYEEDVKAFGKDAYRYWEWKFYASTVDQWTECRPSGPAWLKFVKYRRKEPTFQPEYFSGINREDAKGLIGKKVECSNNGQTWYGPFELRIVTIGISSFQANCGWWVYIRTCSETFADPHPTIKITVNGKNYELPKPRTEAPERGAGVYIFAPEVPRGCFEIAWYNDEMNDHRLKAGVVFLKEEHTKAWADFHREITS